MTNEDAISYLKWARPIKPYSLDKKRVQEAIDMAIKALSADGDLISRKSVIDAIRSMDRNDHIDEYTENVIEYFEKLPSAEKTASEKLDDIIVKNVVQNIYDLLTRHTALLNDIKMMMPKTAEWKIVWKTTLHYECSKCGGTGDKLDKFCKHCGAKMKGAENEQINT